VRARLAFAAAVAALLFSVMAALVGGARGGAQGGPPALASDVRLPDLVQELPSGVRISRTGPATRSEWWLGFESAVSNVGAGPLRVASSRAPGSNRGMSADQLIDRAAGRPQRVAGVGRLRYVRSPDHQHWHLLGFERYELRHADDFSLIVRDRKTGFCLGDRYEVRRRVEGKPPRPTWEGRCGLGRPQLVRLDQGISVGYGDDYPANLEGQWLRLSGLTPGRYVLVHRVNTDGLLHESTRANNASSLLLALRWRDGRPGVDVLDRCPSSDRCPAR
jgi:Lysyl oxidase